MNVLHAYLFIYLVPLVISDSLEHGRHCTNIKSDAMHNCNNLRTGGLKKLRTRIADNTSICHNEDLCRRNLSLTFLRRQLYNSRTLMHFSQMLDACCGPRCTSYGVYKEIFSLDDIDDDVLQNSDIITPIVGTRSTSYLYGFHYLPIINIPSSYYVTLTITEREKMFQLMMSCFGTWPLIVLCVLFSLISGFVIWLLERQKNREEFPERFHIGVYEGFWWSFISMTTVGYGDRSPKTLLGRAYAVTWVLIGITIFSILTGELTNNISEIQSEPNPNLIGKSVGGLMHRLNDLTTVQQHNGFFKGIYFNDTVKGITRLVEMLQNKEIDGFLINRETYYYYRDALRKYSKYAEDKRVYEAGKFDFTEKDFIGEKQTMGMMIKDYKLYDYVKSYFEDNKIQIENCKSSRLGKISLEWNSKTKKVYGITNSFSTVFYPVIAMIVFLAAIGLAVEARRFFVRHQARKELEENLALTV